MRFWIILCLRTARLGKSYSPNPPNDFGTHTTSHHVVPKHAIRNQRQILATQYVRPQELQCCTVLMNKYLSQCWSRIKHCPGMYNSSNTASDIVATSMRESTESQMHRSKIHLTLSNLENSVIFPALHHQYFFDIENKTTVI